MFYQLIYRSRVARHVRFADAQHIAERASQRNASAEISGLLLYTPTHFLQLLEGEKSKVKATFARIAGDQRHTDVEVVAEREIQARSFGDWGMRAVMPRQDTSAEAIQALDEDGALQLLLHAR